MLPDARRSAAGPVRAIHRRGELAGQAVFAGVPDEDPDEDPEEDFDDDPLLPAPLVDSDDPEEDPESDFADSLFGDVSVVFSLEPLVAASDPPSAEPEAERLSLR
jgi:hypothetical protein